MERPAFSSLVSNTDTFAQLKNDYRCGNVSHAYLFVSPDRLLLKILSRAFAALCISGDENSETGLLVQSGLHSDVKIFPACDDDKKRETVLTADIDAITSTLYYRPSMGDKKFYIIDYGETMNASCQNKLLKTLEEPPESAYFIINAGDVSPLLSTVVSRCRQIKPSTFTPEELTAALKEEYRGGGERINLAVSTSRGMLDYCVKMMTDDGYARAFDNAVAVLLSLKSSKNILVNAARVLNYKDRVAETVGFFEIIFRDIMAYHGGGKLMCESLLGDMDRLAAEYSLGATVAIMPALYNAQKRLKLNGNQVGVVDELLFSIAKIKAQYK